MSCRCQRSSVSGRIGNTAQAGRGRERLSDASSARSARVRLAREPCRRMIANSWRRTRISSSFERRGRASSHSSANRFRTTRYTNDQSKQPSLDHGKSAEPSEPNALESRERVCEPYALSVLVALAREGAARAVHPLLPHMNRIAGLLLLAAGGYLFYHWARLRFGDTATVADDPIVSFVVRFSGQARNFADGNGSLILAGAAVIVALAVFASLWQRRRRAVSTGLVRE
jgi:hypothetical protein